MAGAIAISVFNPTEVLKTQIMTNEGNETMRGVVRRVLATDGILGFWAGLAPNITRTFLVNAVRQRFPLANWLRLRFVFCPKRLVRCQY